MSDKTLTRKYIAVKPKGLAHFLWFEQANVTEESGEFIGRDGWGKNGAFTNLRCRTIDIAATIYSDEAQYV